MDSILAALRLAELRPEGDGDGNDALRVAHDLSDLLVNDGQVWQASQFIGDGISPLFLTTATRRMDAYEIAHDKDRVFVSRKSFLNQSSGPDKGYDIRVALQWVPLLQAWGVGDIQAVEALLSGLSWIGKWRRKGWGRVASLSIVEDSEAHVRWKWRNMPLDGNKADPGYAVAVGGLRPPYWDRTRWEPVAVYAGC